MDQPKLLILDYSTTGWETGVIKQGLASKLPISSIHVTTENSIPDNLIHQGFTHVIHTGSVLSINDDASFTPKAVKYIQDARDSGIWQMGICYGHQLICRALLGKQSVRAVPLGFEAGWTEVSFINSAAKLLNIKETERVWQHHFDEVTELPTGSELLATNDHSDVQAYINWDQRLLGTQFHPEFDEKSGNEYFVKDQKFLEKNGYQLDEILQQRPSFDSRAVFFGFFLKQNAVGSLMS